MLTAYRYTGKQPKKILSFAKELSINRGDFYCFEHRDTEDDTVFDLWYEDDMWYLGYCQKLPEEETVVYVSHKEMVSLLKLLSL